MVTAVVFWIKYKELEKIEQWIVLILFLNIFTDTTSYFLIHMEKGTHLFYNLLIPVERILTLIIYAVNEHGISRKRIHYSGTVLIGISAISAVFYYQNITGHHSMTNILTGFIGALLSYVHLRSIMLNTAGQSTTTFYFALANLVYFTLMISAMSALPLALQIGNDFASDIYDINLIGYALWSIILIIGVLGKSKKTAEKRKSKLSI